MKKTLLMFILSSTICFGADYHKELEAVKSGKVKIARAEWWGYNPEDCTASLQKALNSGVKKLTISKQSGPWLVKTTLKLPSNMEIVFEDGAEIKAMRGYFKGIVDCLLKARSRKNLTLRGKGIITMRKADYMDSEKYKYSEHRHTLGLFSCDNIKIIGLTLQQSGGDGIYVNNIKNLLIENVTLDEHHRQGISVISGENILIKNCLIKNTNGTAPQCGIDFEPNYPRERLVNCRVENCRFENNAHSAVNVSLALKGETTPPIDVTVENCAVVGGHYGFSGMVPGKAGEPVGTLRGGKFIIKNCTIENTDASAFYFGSHRTDGEKIIIENCTVNNPTTEVAPIFFLVRPPAVGDFGGIEFKNCRIDAPKAKNLLTYITLMPQCRLTDLAGNVVFNGRKIDLKKHVDSKGYQNNPLMFSAYIPLLGFDSVSDLSIKRLSDKWSFQIDADNVGLKKRWQNTEPSKIAKWPTLKTGHWEKSKCSSPELQKKLRSYDGIGWYAQKISVPAKWKGKKIYLYCGAIDETGKFFINGKLTGERFHNIPDNWLLPFAIRIDPFIDWQKSEQQLVIRVGDSRGGGGIWKPSWLIAE